MIVTAAGQLIAGKRRIARYVEKHGAKTVLISEWHHYAMLPFLRVARDDDGEVHLVTLSAADEESWTVLA